MHGACAEHAQSMRRACAEHAQSMRSACRACAVRVQSMRSARAVRVQCACRACVKSSVCMCRALQSVCGASAVHLHVHVRAERVPAVLVECSAVPRAAVRHLRVG
eukprot:scaffold143701_cov157-Phaeocystis_antarctica.AAC.2